MEHYEHISNSENSWKLAWIHFNGVNVRAYYDLYEGYQIEKQIFRIGNIAEEIVDLLLKLPKSSSLLSDMEAGERLLSLCNVILRTVLCSEEITDNIININNVRTFINENNIENNLEEKIVEHFNTDFNSLNTLFMKKFGIDVIGYITSRRFNAAKELLRFTTKPIDEVTKESGIKDLMTIQQMFLENEGMSPEEYRMKWTQWIKS
jgi:YesN/AraC family two-component response regulator